MIEIVKSEEHFFIVENTPIKFINLGCFTKKVNHDRLRNPISFNEWLLKMDLKIEDFSQPEDLIEILKDNYFEY